MELIVAESAILLLFKKVESLENRKSTPTSAIFIKIGFD
jgi:hypothetical protein